MKRQRQLQDSAGQEQAALCPLKENLGLGNYTPSQGHEFSKPAPAAAADVA